MESKFGNQATHGYQNDNQTNRSQNSCRPVSAEAIAYDLNVRKLARLGRPLTELNEYISESWKIIDACHSSSDMMSDKKDKIRIRN